VSREESSAPDRHGGDREQKTATVGLDDVLRGYRGAYDRADAQYHLPSYNCASFASDIWEAMTGRPLPNGLLVPNPASAAHAVGSERALRTAFAGQKMSDGMEDLIEMIGSGLIPPAL
jgi:hypothetical protein